MSRDRSLLVWGALRMARAIAATYGPHGGLVALDRMQGLLHTKDGASVAREITLSCPVENMGASLVREACLETNELVGDGSTTTAILAASLLLGGHRQIDAGVNPVHIVRGMLKALPVALSVIEEMASPVESQFHLEQIAFVASNGDAAIASNMAEAAMAVGRDGLIQVEDSRGVGITLEFKDGMEVSRGWGGLTLGASFVNDSERMVIRSESCLVAVCMLPLSSVQDVVSIMEEASTLRPHDEALLDPVLILAPYIEGEALKTLYLNNPGGVSSGLRDLSPRPTYFAVPSPGTRHRWADHLGDIAALADATLVDPAAGMDHRKFQRGWFGGFREVTIHRDRSVFVAYDSAQGSIQQRIRVLRAMGGMTTSEHEVDLFRQRRAQLAGGVCLFKMGSLTTTEAALKERRARVEDALSAVSASLSSGVVPGGGTSYLEASEELRATQVSFQGPGERIGWEILASALEAPLRHLVRNSADASGAVLVRVLEARAKGGEPWLGWDVSQGRVRDMAELPSILDPLAVVTASLRSAVSVATTVLMAEVAVTQPRRKR